MVSLKNFKNPKKLRDYLEKKLNINLSSVGSHCLNYKNIKNKNCENMIGTAQIPLGIAGPCKIKNIGRKTKDYFLPLATTEGALVASVSRGCKAASLSGGINVFCKEEGVTRGPVFQTKNLKQGFELADWLKKNFAQLQKQAQKTSSHLKLLKLEPEVVGTRVFVRFYFNTAEAMGMNMASLASQKIADFIKDKKNIDCLSLSGNFCIDKKPSWLNFIKKRGKTVFAECVLNKKTIRTVLKTTPEQLLKVWQSKCFLGSSLSGSLGFNAHFANILAAVFIATGQDPAHIVEASQGITWLEKLENNDIYFSCYIPSLLLGTVGGGTDLATQKQALAILGLKNKKGDAVKLAKIIGAGVLAGELSLLASLASKDLVKAHQTLGKGKHD
jgi:hydroxymethylglutaryl-CoA reductase (NADPH)